MSNMNKSEQQMINKYDIILQKIYPSNLFCITGILEKELPYG